MNKHDLTTGELRQLDKHNARQRYVNRKRDQRRANGVTRIKLVKVQAVEPQQDDELVGIDLRRVRSLRDLDLEA